MEKQLRGAQCLAQSLDWEAINFDQKNDSVLVENSKSQIPNHKQIPMIKIQNTKPVWDIGYSNLRFIWNLVLDI
jgi:hypothetical protein